MVEGFERGGGGMGDVEGGLPGHVAYVALGSNLGDSLGVLERAFEALERLSAEPVRRSSIWRSSPVDCPAGAPPFLNAVAALVPLVRETPESLLEKLQGLEVAAGRRPKRVLNEPRVLDLDLIVFGEERREGPRLVLPHPRAHERRFVLAPWCELAPELVVPGQVRTVRELLASLPTGETVERLSSRSEGQDVGGGAG